MLTGIIEALKLRIPTISRLNSLTMKDLTTIIPEHFSSFSCQHSTCCFYGPSMGPQHFVWSSYYYPPPPAPNTPSPFHSRSIKTICLPTARIPLALRLAIRVSLCRTLMRGYPRSAGRSYRIRTCRLVVCVGTKQKLRLKKGSFVSGFRMIMKSGVPVSRPQTYMSGVLEMYKMPADGYSTCPYKQNARLMLDKNA